MTTRGDEAEVYLENLAPLFFIDQNEGWTDLQSLQVYRYGLQEIAEVAVEYLLGATDALTARVGRQTAVAWEAQMKGAALALSDRVVETFRRQGWVHSWSSHGSVADILTRWSARTLFEVARDEFRFDPSAERDLLEKKADAARGILGDGAIDPLETTAASKVSQSLVDLKSRRHDLREQLRTARTQSREQRQLAESLEHRLHSAKDVLRFKREGIGRMDIVECPTCHRSLDPSTFDLTAQSATSVQAHIDALGRDRMLVLGNAESTEAQALRIAAELARLDSELRGAERAVANVNVAVGSVREQLTKAASDLAQVERDLDRYSALMSELTDLQNALDEWIKRAKGAQDQPRVQFDHERRRSSFVTNLRVLLRELGHSALTPEMEGELRLDEQYVPYLGPRRLRSMGSASDQPRLVAAYVLAIAEASYALNGFHPGFVVLDEPLQQNPDPRHRDLFIGFLESSAARQLNYQTIIFTSLRDDEIERLRVAGVPVHTPEGRHFLQRVRPA